MDVAALKKMSKTSPEFYNVYTAMQSHLDPPEVDRLALAEVRDLHSTMCATWATRLKVHEIGKKQYGELGVPPEGGELALGELASKCSVPHRDGYYLFRLIREFRPRNCLELGTCVGISAAYIASAMRLNGFGSLVTLEGVESLAQVAIQVLNLLGLKNTTVYQGAFDQSLPLVLSNLETVNFAFIDGHHSGTATRQYFKLIEPYCAPGTVLVFDDINWPDGMNEAWNKIKKHKRVKFHYPTDEKTRMGTVILKEER